MDEILTNYSEFDIDEAFCRIEHQLENGYVDIGGIMDDVELDIIRTALELFKERLKEKENDNE